jgi:hypothetical protein
LEKHSPAYFGAPFAIYNFITVELGSILVTVLIKSLRVGRGDWGHDTQLQSAHIGPGPWPFPWDILRMFDTKLDSILKILQSELLN